MQIGLELTAESFKPPEIVSMTRTAAQAGLDFGAMSDHFHPGLDRQGHCGLTWSMPGAVAASTERIGLVTGVTRPSFRCHPAIIALGDGLFWTESDAEIVDLFVDELAGPLRALLPSKGR